MHSTFTDSLPSLLAKAAVVLLSCLDDALLVVLSKLGLTVPGLQGLSTLLMAITVCFWLYRLLRLMICRDRPNPSRSALSN